MNPDTTASLTSCPAGSAGDGAVFLGGLAHSGKTELRRCLDELPGFTWYRKTYLWPRHHGRYGDLSDPAARERCFEALRIEPEIATTGVDLDAACAAALGSAPGASYSALFAEVHRRNAGPGRWGIQVGGIEAFGPSIMRELPAARFVHLVRDPRHLLADSALVRLRAQIAAWRTSADLALDNQGRWPARYLVLRYEDLMLRPVATVETVCAFVGAPFTAAVQAVAAGLSPPLARVVGARRRVLIERSLGARLAALGYGEGDA